MWVFGAPASPTFRRPVSRRSPPVIRVKGNPFSPFNPILTGICSNIDLYPLPAPSISLLGADMPRPRPLSNLSHGSETCYLGSYPVGSTISNSSPPPTHVIVMQWSFQADKFYFNKSNIAALTLNVKCALEVIWIGLELEYLPPEDSAAEGRTASTPDSLYVVCCIC